MFAETTRQFDLYDLFSIFVPGASFIIAALPLFPNNALNEVYLISAIIILGGIISGRWIQGAAVKLNDSFEDKKHRNIFENELRRAVVQGSNGAVSADMVESYYERLYNMFPEALPENDDDIHINGSMSNSAYQLTRSIIHMDARGRSRTFQAISDFYRNLLVASALLAIMYWTAAIIMSLNVSISVGSESLLASFELPPLYVGIGSVFIFTIPYVVFWDMWQKYQIIYVQYLFSDFLSIARTNEDVTAS